MSRKGGFFGNPYERLFDINNDGETDIIERTRAYMFMSSEMESNDDYDLDTDDEYADETYGDTEEPFDPYYEGDEYGIYAEDFDSLDEYYEAVEDARFEATGGYYIYDTPVVSHQPASTVSNTPSKERTYDNVRQEDAASYMDLINDGMAYIPSDSSKTMELEKCQFILDGKCIAAKYLTSNGDFLLAQAVKENFDVPVKIKEETKHIETTFCDLLLEIAEEDCQLAVDIWKWCLKEFGPYRKYNNKPFWLYNSILFSSKDYHPDFIDVAVKEFSDEWFCKEVFENNPEFPSKAQLYIIHALKDGKVDIAVNIFSACLANVSATSQDKEILVKCIISDATDWKEKETMELVVNFLFPVLKKDSNKRIQRLYPEYLEKAQSYISSMEESGEYRYKGKYEWRNKYKDRKDYNVLNYKTEDEYLKAVYSWRNRYIPTAEHFGMDITAYETFDEFEFALRDEVDKEKQRKIE